MRQKDYKPTTSVKQIQMHFDVSGNLFIEKIAFVDVELTNENTFPLEIAINYKLVFTARTNHFSK